MTKRSSLILVVLLLVVPTLLTACSTESRDAAEDYMEAVLKGDEAKATANACEDHQDNTIALIEFYDATYENIVELDLKYDLGKGNNQKEVIVTGSFKYIKTVDLTDLGVDVAAFGDEWFSIDDLDDEDYDIDEDEYKEIELAENENTRIVLEMKEEGDDWCVSAESEFEGTVLAVEEVEAESEDVEAEAEDAETEDAESEDAEAEDAEAEDTEAEDAEAEEAESE